MNDTYPCPPDDSIDIGPGHKIVYSQYEGDVAGVIEWHQKADGSWCRGWVPFNGKPWGKQFGDQGWNVEQETPLTLTPSILCRSCGSHGFIRDGKWVAA